MMKQKKHRKIPALAAGTTLVAAMPLMASCSTDYHSRICSWHLSATSFLCVTQIIVLSAYEVKRRSKRSFSVSASSDELISSNNRMLPSRKRLRAMAMRCA